MEPEISEPQSVKQAPIETLPPKPIWKSKLLWGFVLISSLVAFIAGGLLVSASNNIVQPIVSTLTPTFTPTPSPDPTADWKTYENSTFGFKLKYPTGWFIAEKAERFGDPREFLVSFNPEGDVTYHVEVFHYQGEDLKAFINSWYGKIEGGPSLIAPVALGNNSGLRFFMQKASVNPSGVANITIRNGNNVFTVSGPLEKGDAAHIMENKTLKLIVSSFKFTK